MSNIYTY